MNASSATATTRRGSVLARVQSIYETNPYPAVDASIVLKPKWRIPPLQWIAAVATPGAEQEQPKRVLVAGCGTGSEAFALRQRLPEAEIVAADFSPRSIAIARRLQREHGTARRIRFVVADLSSRALAETVGRGFDLISCHGVLSYIPHPERVLRNLSACLSPVGAIYLGVNGSEHFSVRLRPVLQSFGIDVREIEEGRKLRDTLRFADTALGIIGRHKLSSYSTAFLGSDLFGTFNQTLSLDEWIEIGARAKLHFQGCYLHWKMVRKALDQENARQLLPRSRAHLQRLLEHLAPFGFHTMVFTKEAPPEIPWTGEELLDWRPRVTGLYQVRLPKQSGNATAVRSLVFRSRPLNTRLEWRMSEWQVEILRQSDGSRSLREIVAAVPMRMRQREMRQQLFLLFQLLVINLLPPKKSRRRAT